MPYCFRIWLKQGIIGCIYGLQIRSVPSNGSALGFWNRVLLKVLPHYQLDSISSPLIIHLIIFFCLRCSRDSRSSRSNSNPPQSRRRPQRSCSSQESILMLWRSSTSRGRRLFTPHSSRPRPQNPSRHSLLLPIQPRISLSPTSPPRNNPLWASLMLMNPPQDRWVKTGPSQIRLLQSQEQCNLSHFCLPFVFLNLIYEHHVDPGVLWFYF